MNSIGLSEGMVALKPIKDPGIKSKGSQTVAISPAIDQKMKLRDCILKEMKSGTPHFIKTKTPSKIDSKLSALETIGGKDHKFETAKVCPRVIEAIESVDNHKFVCIGKDSNRMFCGPVIHRIPVGGYISIGGGTGTCLPSPPLNKDGSFKYERDKQLAVKVGNKVGTDYLVIVAKNGCIFLDSGSSASFKMPIFVVELTGEYYKLEKGQRVFHLASGSHLLIYTNEAPILFPRVDYKKSPKPTISVKSPEKPVSPQKEKTEKVKSVEKEDKKVKSDEKVVKSVEKEDKKVKSDEKVVKSVEKEDKKVKSDEEVAKKVDSDEKLDEKIESKTKIEDELKLESKEESKDPPKKEEPKVETKEEEPKIEPKKEEPKVEPKEELEEAVAPKDNSIQTEDRNEDQSEGISRQKIIGIIIAIIVGLFTLYLFFGTSKGSEDKNKPKTKD